MKLYTIKTLLLDLVFPRFCLGCQKELGMEDASFVCRACFEKITLSSGIRCHICGLRNGSGVCRRCRKKTPLKGLLAACGYHDPIIKKMIHNFKYQSVESLKKPLAQLMINYLEKEKLIRKLQNRHPMSGEHLSKPLLTSPCQGRNLAPSLIREGWGGFLLVPIPLTLRRKINRGFNQSELLAQELSVFLNIPVINLLKRQKFSLPQAEIADWQKRKENISGVFLISTSIKTPPNLPLSGEEPSSLPDKGGLGWVGNQYKKVILVDDVSTSGATLEEAARVLKEAGVKEVYGLVVAKG